MISKTYAPQDIEAKWYQYWLENKHFASKPNPDKYGPQLNAIYGLNGHRHLVPPIEQANLVEGMKDWALLFDFLLTDARSARCVHEGATKNLRIRSRI